MMKPLFVSFLLSVAVGGCTTPQSSEDVTNDAKGLGGALLKPRKNPAPRPMAAPAVPDTREMEAPGTSVKDVVPRAPVAPVNPVNDKTVEFDPSKVSHSADSVVDGTPDKRCEQLGGCPDLVQVSDDDFSKTCDSYCDCTNASRKNCGNKPPNCSCGVGSIQSQ